MSTRQLADAADTVTRGAALTGFLSGVIDWLHSTFGWLASGQGLAMISVLVAIASGLLGLRWRRQEAKYRAQDAEYARQRNEREIEYHAALLADLRCMRDAPPAAAKKGPRNAE